MNTPSFVLLSLRHHRRIHTGVVLGTAVGTAVLVGALLVGDSVRESLRRQTLDRIGRVDAALISHDRFFMDDLAARLGGELSGVALAPLLQLAGSVSTGGGARRANDVQILGVDPRFFALGPSREGTGPPAGGEALVNERLALQLGVDVGDQLLLRVERPSAMPREAALATVDDLSLALRLRIGAVLPDGSFGRFGLAASQIPTSSLFLPLDWLQERLGLGPRANLLLAGGAGEGAEVASRADEALQRAWTLADAELEEVAGGPEGVLEIRSRRIFLDDSIVAAAERSDEPALGVLTYFVNALIAGKRETPYSMVAAVGPIGARTPGGTPGLDWGSIVPRDMPEDGIAVNAWLADDLGVTVGDPVTLRYFALGSDRRLVEESRSFRVSAVVPLQGVAADPTLMPDFPGLADSESCRDWEPGVTVHLDRIRDQDEAYWEEHRGTPKAFVTLDAGREMWSSPFGSLTALRASRETARLPSRLHAELDPASIGLFFRDVRGPALAASSPSTDFGGLFLGLSLFLIVAALLLTALLFVFGVEQRAREIGTLLALGFPVARVRWLLLAEATVLALLGGGVGSLVGVGYTQAVLRGLETVWRDAIGGTSLELSASAGTVAGGALASVLAAIAAIAWTVRRQVRRPTLELLGARAGVPAMRIAGGPRRIRAALSIAVVAFLGAVGIVLGTDAAGGAAAAGGFFAAGALLLVGTLAASRAVLLGIDRFTIGAGTVAGLGVRSGARRPGRSLATVALLAGGVFLVVGVGANRLGPVHDVTERASGTGGFALFGRSTLGVPYDLESDEGREALALDSEDLEATELVSLRVRDGDDASCLNLGSPHEPRLVGVDPKALASRGAFTFAKILDVEGADSGANPWLLLELELEDGAIPAIGDDASVTWTLHREVGDAIEYVDERGRRFDVRIVATLANSILQGNLFVSEQRFRGVYPSESGYRMFLIDAPPGRADGVASSLVRALEDVGLEVTTTASRLAEFNAVQNTYILIFQMLGGLGLLLGSVGLGMVVLRNALERRGELALARAVGFTRRTIRWLLSSEHGLLLGLGLVAGIVPAVVAVLPAVLGAGVDLSLGPLALLVLAITASGALWVWLAASIAVRGPLLDALRDE